VRVLLALLALTGAGCAASNTPPEGPLPPLADGPCNAAPAQHLVGQMISVRLNEVATRLTGARQGRVLRPGQIVTMEFRADRLNFYVDSNNRIERITCG
jgi:hypothetical protein